MVWPFRRKPKPEIDINRPAVDASAILRRARRLRFQVKPVAFSTLAGAYQGARPGTGLVFAELRAYQPGDDVRYLDWNVTARLNAPYVRHFVEERSLTLWLVVDVSASLQFGPEGRSKADRAAQAAALLATVAARNGDRVGLIMVSDRIEAQVSPSTGDRHLARIVRTLVATPTVSRRTDLTLGLSRIGNATRRALVVVLSDFVSDGPLPIAPWRQIAAEHQIIALRLVEPRENALPDAGLIDLDDAEQGTRRTVDSGSRRVRDHYQSAAEGRRMAFRRWCSSAGVAGSEMDTSVDPIGPLTRVLQGRDRTRRRP